jgi:hypothetical protein
MTGPDGHPADTSLEEAITPEDETDEELLAEHHSIDPDTRAQLFERDGYRCQANGCLGTHGGGSARLLAQRVRHHADPQPDTLDNLVTHCHRCARWLSQLPGRDTLRPVLRDRLNGVDIQSTWAEIIQYLDEEGPASPAVIRDNVSLGSKGGVRKAIYRLMQLDIEHADVETQLVVKDQRADVYGLPRQIPEENRSRGTIPLDPERRQTRIIDEIVRRLDTALEGFAARLLETLTEDADSDQEKLAVAIERTFDDAADDIVATCVGRDPQQLRSMRVRADAFNFPFAEWADSNRPRADERAAIDAVDVLASVTDNISRPLLSDVLAEAFEAHEEPRIATLLDDWTWASDQPARQATLTSATQTDHADKSTPERADQSAVTTEQTSTSNEDSSTTGNQTHSGAESAAIHPEHPQGPRVDSLTAEGWCRDEQTNGQFDESDGGSDDD